MADTRKIPFTILRFNPETDTKHRFDTFIVDVLPGMTVLEGLHQIKARHDATLAWRYSCRMGVCGSCGMLINGRATLACNTQILDVSPIAIAIAPLPNFPIIKDLVPDLDSMFQKHREIKPWIIRENSIEQNTAKGEFYQSPEQLVEYLQFSYCIKCGCCMAACPTMATDAQYLGPQPLAQAYRYEADSRDQGFNARKPVLDRDSGLFSCHYGSECSVVCPKGVDPAKAIQLMKRRMLLDLFHLYRKKNAELCPDQGKPSAQDGS
ncbi:succinate dehydrogenase iron-sulfur subunit [bacterium]|nr:succinate dehydrogenase iron-sulfur subunit [candidate division CSSED10-310 bacterium]